MDRSRRRSGLLIAAGLGLVLAAAAPAPPPPLRAMRWLDPGADPATAMTRGPPECLALPSQTDARWRVEVGRAAFRDPLILGGQAARAGLSCESCHRDGRNNPQFLFPGISGPPGTADVTTFLFSAHRGVHTPNPRPIPDLGGPKAALRIPQAANSPALEAFIRGLVTEEFDGPPPPRPVIDGLAAYVRALDPTACRTAAPIPVRVDDAVADARRAVAAAGEAARRGEAATAVIMLQAARARLGDIFERYPGPNLAAARQTVAAESLDLAAIVEQVRRHCPGADLRIVAWIARSRDWGADLRRQEALSLYDRGVLASAIAGRSAY